MTKHRNRQNQDLGRRVVAGARKAFDQDARRELEENVGRKRTYIIVLLDGSGSMKVGKSITMKGYNEQVDIIRGNAESGGETLVSLMVFNDRHCRWMYQNRTVHALEKLDDDNYRPNDGTPLYDAVGDALDAVERFAGIQDPNTAVLFAVVTDGEDTTSTRWRERTRELGRRVGALTETGRWTFTLLGPKQGLNSLAELLHIERSNVAAFDPSSLASRDNVMRSMAAATTSYMSARAEGACFVANLYAGHDDGAGALDLKGLNLGAPDPVPGAVPPTR